MEAPGTEVPATAMETSQADEELALRISKVMEARMSSNLLELPSPYDDLKIQVATLRIELSI
eukprot:6748033-Pyramimonas_sp.AAC.1